MALIYLRYVSNKVYKEYKYKKIRKKYNTLKKI